LQVQVKPPNGYIQGKTCLKCAHLNVCAVYRAIAPLIKSFEEKPPFKPEDLAVICKEYLASYRIQADNLNIP